ncbi:MAG: hypothetical protein SNJ73_09085, partial [Acetobacteraceae bacterium]
GGQVFAALYDQSPAEQGVCLPAPGGLPTLTDETGALRRVGPNNRPTLYWTGLNNQGMRVATLRTHRGPSLCGLVLAARRGAFTNRPLLAIAPNPQDNPAQVNAGFMLRNGSNAATLELLAATTTAAGLTSAVPLDQPRVYGGIRLSGVADWGRRSFANATSSAANTVTYSDVPPSLHVALGYYAHASSSGTATWVGEMAEFALFGNMTPTEALPRIVADMNGFYGAT